MRSFSAFIGPGSHPSVGPDLSLLSCGLCGEGIVVYHGVCMRRIFMKTKYGNHSSALLILATRACILAGSGLSMSMFLHGILRIFIPLLQ